VDYKLKSEESRRRMGCKRIHYEEESFEVRKWAAF
jgi:hypothetical protein